LLVICLCVFFVIDYYLLLFYCWLLVDSYFVYCWLLIASYFFVFFGYVLILFLLLLLVIGC